MAARGALSCPACGGGLVPWREVASGEPSDERTHLLLRCVRCGSAVTYGEAPGAEAYESGVYASGEPRARALVRALQRAATMQPVRMLRRAGLAHGASVLDAGAGRGRLVAALREAGFAARGLDPSERSVALSGGLVSLGRLEEHHDSGLDAVVLWHVLEHLDDPGAALERVRGWLAPGGLLLVGVPNPASLQARIGAEGWLHWDAPRHRVHLTPEGLRSLLAGFEVVKTRHLVWEQNPHAMWMALLTRLGATPNAPFHLLKRNLRPTARDLAVSGLAGPPLVPVAVALEAAAAAARRGGTVAAVARRVEG